MNRAARNGFLILENVQGTSIEAPGQNFLSVLLPSKIVRVLKPYRMCHLELVLEIPACLYSHSIVPGGLLVMSNTQRFTPFTSLMMRLASFSSKSYGTFTQSAVIPSCDSTARMAMV